jgi:hypothetical protein
MSRSRAVFLSLDATRSRHVDISNEGEAVQLLGVEPNDLTALPFGAVGQQMLMSASAQLDDTPINREASLVIQRVGGVSVAVRGGAISFPRGVPWESSTT